MIIRAGRIITRGISLSRERSCELVAQAPRFAFANLESRNSWRIILEYRLRSRRNVCARSLRARQLDRKFEVNTLEVSALKLRGTLSYLTSRNFFSQARDVNRANSPSREKGSRCAAYVRLTVRSATNKCADLDTKDRERQGRRRRASSFGVAGFAMAGRKGERERGKRDRRRGPPLITRRLTPRGKTRDKKFFLCGAQAGGQTGKQAGKAAMASSSSTSMANGDHGRSATDKQPLLHVRDYAGVDRSRGPAQSSLARSARVARRRREGDEAGGTRQQPPLNFTRERSERRLPALDAPRL